MARPACTALLCFGLGLAAATAARAETAPKSLAREGASVQPGQAAKPSPAKQPPLKREPLSAEDQALVRELELVECSDLLRNLELFERPADAPARAQSGPAVEPQK